MSRWLLDTNVISEIRRPRPDAGVLEFLASRPLEDLYVPSIVLAEIRHGIGLVESDERRVAYQQWLDLTVRPRFESRVLQVTEEAFVRWRILARDGRKQGYTYPEPDLLIAAVALENAMTIVTRNTVDFARAGVSVFNPWSQT